MVTQGVPITPKWPIRSRPWTSMTPSCPLNTLSPVSLVTHWRSQRKTQPNRSLHSGQEHIHPAKIWLLLRSPRSLTVIAICCLSQVFTPGFVFSFDFQIQNEICTFFVLFLSRIKFPVQNVKGKKRKADEEEEKAEEDNTLIVEPHVTPNRGPYPYNQPKRWEMNDCAQTWAHNHLDIHYFNRINVKEMSHTCLKHTCL